MTEQFTFSIPPGKEDQVSILMDKCGFPDTDIFSDAAFGLLAWGVWGILKESTIAEINKEGECAPITMDWMDKARSISANIDDPDMERIQISLMENPPKNLACLIELYALIDQDQDQMLSDAILFLEEITNVLTRGNITIIVETMEETVLKHRRSMPWMANVKPLIDTVSGFIESLDLDDFGSASGNPED